MSTTVSTYSPAAESLFGPEPVRFMTDGGLETTLVFLDGLDLPEFAAFPLLDEEAGRDAFRRYFAPYFDVAEASGVGMVVDTPTWRANPDWAARLGYDQNELADANHRAVDFVRELAGQRPRVPAVFNGVIGPRGDGYVVGQTMSAVEAASYHRLQASAFAQAGADMVSAVTMTYSEEAIGVAQAASRVGLPAVIGFTVETDGRLPSGERLADAIDAVDRATDTGPVWYMINCAHPSHFEQVLAGGGTWLERIKTVRANASRMSHDELDEAPELDRGDPTELGQDYVRLLDILPEVRVVGGCCGTDHEHLAEICGAVA